MVIYLLTSSLTASYAENSGSVFSSKCSGCHTIGKGPLVGPDLAKCIEWKSEDLLTAIKRMEKMAGPISADDTKAIVNYIQTYKIQDKKNQYSSKDIQKSVSDEQDKGNDAESSKIKDLLNQASFEDGKDFYFGNKKLANGGMACVSCHSLDSDYSALGPSLHGIANKMKPETLVISCEQTPFKVMKAAYAKHSITRQESLALAKYFIEIKNQNINEKEPVGVYSGLGFACILAFTAFQFISRKPKASDKLRRR